ncbi:DMT family transporter [Rhodoferax sp.]|uniref:DMT family transporter n=1 Tax=Rhodoferax sp. TaxID=50421 RepID=UPI001EB578C5|nr:DMT family transporter [Rhodoferax sp.]MBT9505741.1 DMT family transporter [Rhodoferax sp.]
MRTYSSTAAPNPATSGWQTHLALVAFILLVASSPAVTRLAVTKTLTPYDLILMRCGIGGLILLPYFLMHLREMSRRLLVVGFLLAFFQGWGTHLTTVIGLQFAPAAHASALGPGFISVWVAVWAWLFYRQPPSRIQLTSLALIALGAVVLLLNSSGAAFTPQTVLGDLLFLCASAFGAIYLVYIQKNQVPPMQGAAMVAVYSGLVVVPWYMASPLQSRIMDTPVPELIIQVLYQGVGAGALFVALLGFIVVRMGSQRFSMVVACVPILALLFGRWIAGDGISMVECVAIGLVSTGVLYGACANFSLYKAAAN